MSVSLHPSYNNCNSINYGIKTNSIFFVGDNCPQLNSQETALLSLGLNFVLRPVPLFDQEILDNFNEFSRIIKIRYEFARSDQVSMTSSATLNKKLRVPNPSYQSTYQNKFLDNYLEEVHDKINEQLTIHPRTKHYLPRMIRTALNSLTSNKDLIIKDADKNLGTVVCHRIWYETEALKQLHCVDSYIRVTTPPPSVQQHYDELRNILDRNHHLHFNNIQHDNRRKSLTIEAKYMLQFYDVTKHLNNNSYSVGKFYLTIKVHKATPCGRPIVSSLNLPTYFTSKYLDFQLQRVMKFLPSFIGNSTDLICLLERTKLNLQSITERNVFFSADVESLYPSIDINDGLLALRRALIAYNTANSINNNEVDSNHPLIEIDFIIELTTWVLNNNYFEFGLNTIWKQIRGTAMGTPVAVTFACIYLGVLEKEAFDKMAIYPFIIYKRYIDDQIGIAKSKELAMEFIQIFRSLRPTIKITFELSNNEINFLDLTLFRGERFLFEEIVDIKVYQKPTNKYVYLPHTSYHSTNVFKFIPAELRRYKLICSNQTDYLKIKKLFFDRLHNRGYSTDFLEIMNDTDKTFIRNNLLRQYLCKQRRKLTASSTNRIPILYKIKHNPRYQDINIKECIKIPEYLYQDPTTQLVFGKNQKHPLLCTSCSPNLRKILVRSRHKFNISEENLQHDNDNTI
jgi:hypothetical protein